MNEFLVGIEIAWFWSMLKEVNGGRLRALAWLLLFGGCSVSNEGLDVFQSAQETSIYELNNPLWQCGEDSIDPEHYPDPEIRNILRFEGPPELVEYGKKAEKILGKERAYVSCKIQDDSIRRIGNVYTPLGTLFIKRRYDHGVIQGWVDPGTLKVRLLRLKNMGRDDVLFRQKYRSDEIFSWRKTDKKGYEFARLLRTPIETRRKPGHVELSNYQVNSSAKVLDLKQQGGGSLTDTKVAVSYYDQVKVFEANICNHAIAEHWPDCQDKSGNRKPVLAPTRWLDDYQSKQSDQRIESCDCNLREDVRLSCWWKGKNGENRNRKFRKIDEVFEFTFPRGDKDPNNCVQFTEDMERFQREQAIDSVRQIARQQDGIFVTDFECHNIDDYPGYGRGQCDPIYQ